MNDPYRSTVHAKGKKQIRSSAALALVVGLALLLPGAAAMAGDPIPGVDVKLGKNPSGIPVSVPTGADGAYQFKGLAAGSYDLFVAGRLVQTISVDKGSIRGVLSRELDGKASITFNGQQVNVVLDLPSAPVNTSRSNKKAGIAKGEEPPPDDVLPSAPVSTSRSNKKAGKVAENNSPLPTNRGIIVGAGPGGGPHASPDDGDVKPGIAEANSALGGRDAWDDTWKTAPPPGDYDGDGKPGIAEANDVLMQVSTTRGTAPRPDGGDEKLLPGIAGTPIQGTAIGLEGDPGSVKVSAKTDVNGAYQFTGLPAGKYKLILPDKSVKSITIDAGGTTRGKVMRSGDGVIVTGDFEGSPAKVIGAIAIGAKSPAAPGKTIEIFDRWGATGGISGGFGGGPNIPGGIGGASIPGGIGGASIPGGIGGAGAPGAGMRP